MIKNVRAANDPVEDPPVNESRSIRKLALNTLVRSQKSGDFIDRALNRTFSDKSLTVKDKKFLTELVYGTTRMRGLLNYYIKELFTGKISNIEPQILNNILLGLYQILYMDSVPDYAAINESVELSKELKGEKAAGLVNAVLRNFLRKQEVLDGKIESLPIVEKISLKYSHPGWMIKRWLGRYGEKETIILCELNNTAPKLSLRKNRMINDHPNFNSVLNEESSKISDSDIIEGYYTFDGGMKSSLRNAINSGEITVQDVSAGIPVVLLDPKEGDTVIDLCAAPGGKTGAIAEKMDDRGKIIAVESDSYRLTLIKEHIDRLKLKSVELINADATKIELPGADKILIDAPCTGTGVLSKRADSRWRKKIENIRELAQLQLSLLQNASTCLKKSGTLVYSTCTLEPEENWGVVHEFLRDNTDFKVVSAKGSIKTDLVDKDGAVATYPFKHYIDGSFCVRLAKE